MENEEIKTDEPELTEEALREMMGNYSAPAKIAATEAKENEQTSTVSEIPVESQNDSVDSSAPYGRFANGKPRKKPAKNSPPSPATNADFKDKENAKIEAGILIDGAMFLLLVNMLVPLVIASLNNYFSHDKISPEQIELTKEQEKKFAPLVEKCMQGIAVSGDPKWILFFGLMTVFGMNFLMAKMTLKE